MPIRAMGIGAKVWIFDTYPKSGKILAKSKLGIVIIFSTKFLVARLGFKPRLPGYEPDELSLLNLATCNRISLPPEFS
jgi:hypothetical protein